MDDLGKLSSRVEIERPGTVRDPEGQPIEGWTSVCRVWADIANLRGLEAIRAGATTSTVQTSIRIRLRPGITAGMRVRDLVTGERYAITAALPDRRGKKYLYLTCEASDVGAEH